jgi:hypothetical protein
LTQVSTTGCQDNWWSHKHSLDFKLQISFFKLRSHSSCLAKNRCPRILELDKSTSQCLPTSTTYKQLKN